MIGSAAVPANSFGGTRVDCPTGYQAISGGVSPQNVLTMQVTESAPFVEGADIFTLSNGQHGAGTGWLGEARDTSGSAQSVKVAVTCSPTG